MNAKKAKRLRKRAQELTRHAPDTIYHNTKTQRLGECTKGAYRALKSGRFTHVAL